MRLLVTGASGFLGRNILLGAPRSWGIVGLYHRSTDFPGFLESQGLCHVRTVRCDLTQIDEVRRLQTLIGGAADATLYLAANSDPSRSAKDPLGDLEANTVALLNFLEYCPTRHLVYVSSGAVYDGQEGPVSPASPTDPRLPYAVSKLASERYVRFYSERRGAPESYVIVRFFGAYGPYEPARKVTTRFVTALREGRCEFMLRGDGQNLIDFMYVDDAVDGLLRLVESAGCGITLDFAAGAPMTLNDLVLAMARALGTSVTIRHEGETEEYIRFRTTDTVMRDRFGVVPRIPLEEGLKRLQASLASTSDATARLAQSL